MQVDEGIWNLALYLSADFPTQIFSIVEEHLHLFGFMNVNGDPAVESVSHNAMATIAMLNHPNPLHFLGDLQINDPVNLSDVPPHLVLLTKGS